jgi:hypothetical protein
MRTLKVLLLGAGKRVSLAKLLKATGEKMAIDIEILSLETSGDVPIADEAKVFVGGRFSDLNCLSELREIWSWPATTLLFDFFLKFRISRLLPVVARNSSVFILKSEVLQNF